MVRAFDKGGDELHWDAFRQGDEEAYVHIYRTYAPVLFKYGMKVASDRELVKDAIQDLFVYLWEAHGRLGSTDSIQYYLFRALRRVIAGKLDKTRSVLDEDAIQAYILPYESQWIEQQTDENNAARLNHELESLPQRQKEAVFLRFYSDLEFDEIAALMGINRRAVYKLIYKAIDALQKNMLISLAGFALLAVFALYL